MELRLLVLGPLLDAAMVMMVGCQSPQATSRAIEPSQQTTCSIA